MIWPLPLTLTMTGARPSIMARSSSPSTATAKTLSESGREEGRAWPGCASPASGQARQIVSWFCQASRFHAPASPAHSPLRTRPVNRDYWNCEGVSGLWRLKVAACEGKAICKPGTSAKLARCVRILIVFSWCSLGVSPLRSRRAFGGPPAPPPSRYLDLTVPVLPLFERNPGRMPAYRR
jgi:hypothetical protein